MQAPQLELWSAEPHATPPIYQQLTPPQRKALIDSLAELMLKAVQIVPTSSSTANPTHSNHERS
jgi:hypothetical protein